MFRKLLSWLMRADLEPAVNWSESEALEVLARVTAEVPRGWSGRETVEQIACACEGGIILLKRYPRSGFLVRVSFRGPLDGRQMRLTEMQPAPHPIYRLQVWPLDGQCEYACARRTWFGLWRNEPPMELGAMIGYLESANREMLKDLRHRLLGGQIPDSLQTEEAMWERINNMSEGDRRGAMAALAMQSLGAVDRQFHEAYPDAGPIPEDLQPAFEAMQKRLQEMGRAAATAPPDTQLSDLMLRFVADATRQGPKATNDGTSD